MKTFPSESARAGFVTGWSRGKSIWTSDGTAACGAGSGRRSGKHKRRKAPIRKLADARPAGSTGIGGLIGDAVQRSLGGLNTGWSEEQRQGFALELQRQMLIGIARGIHEILGSSTPILEFPLGEVRSEEAQTQEAQQYYELFEPSAFAAPEVAPQPTEAAPAPQAVPNAPRPKWIQELRQLFSQLQPSFRGNELLFEGAVELTVEAVRARRSEILAQASQQAYSQELDLLKRRVAKLRETLSQHKFLLRKFRGMADCLDDEGIASIYREVQGIAQQDPFHEAKRGMLVDIFQQNLDLRERLAG